MAENQDDTRKLLSRIEGQLERLERKISLIYGLAVFMLVLLGFSVLAPLLVGLLGSGGGSVIFPAAVVGIALLMLLFRRGYAP